MGKEHPDTLTSMANLASIFVNQGRWKEAEELEMDNDEDEDEDNDEDVDAIQLQSLTMSLR